MRYDDVLAAIVPVDQSLVPAVQAHLNDLTKPLGSLGRLEEIAMRYCLARGAADARVGRKKIFCFAGDHGVVVEGVSAYPKEVTRQMVANMTRGGAAISVLARHIGAELAVVDIGVDGEVEGGAGLVRRKVLPGTANIAVGPAMSRADAVRAIEVGMDLAAEAADAGITLLGTGEMGIGNTTPSSALFAAYLGFRPEAVIGRGTGVDEMGLVRKRDAVERALAANRAQLGDALGTLAALGGLEIAGICGLVLGAAARRVPVVIDGFISCAGALAAMRICPAAGEYLFFAHLSQERGHRVVVDALGVRPIVDLDMRLGEGTGAAVAMGIIEGAMKLYHEMATFSAAGVSTRE